MGCLRKLSLSWINLIFYISWEGSVLLCLVSSAQAEFPSGKSAVRFSPGPGFHGSVQPQGISVRAPAPFSAEPWAPTIGSLHCPLPFLLPHLSGRSSGFISPVCGPKEIACDGWGLGAWPLNPVSHSHHPPHRGPLMGMDALSGQR